MNAATLNITFGIVSPAGGLEHSDFDAGLNALERRGFTTKVFPHAREKCGYLSAPAEMRAADLSAAWSDDSIDAILCSRGGFGSAHLLPLLDWEQMKKRPLPLLGYSDITALHFAMDKFGVGRCVTAPMLKDLAEIDDDSFRALSDVLNRNDHEFRGVEVLVGEAHFSGRPLAGNLTVMTSLAGTPYFPDPSGRVLFVEEVGEPLYRIDRMLTQLEQSGVFRVCSGAVFGSFTGGDFTDAELRELLLRVMKTCGKPAVMRFPFGHKLPFRAIDFSALARVSGGKIEQLFA